MRVPGGPSIAAQPGTGRCWKMAPAFSHNRREVSVSYPFDYVADHVKRTTLIRSSSGCQSALY